MSSVAAKPAFGCVGNTIRLRSGLYLNLADPRPEQFTFGDIAGALSKICRFGGQIERLYSVAEHCVHCCDLARREGQNLDTQAAALMHDAAEAFCGDVVKPLKIMLPRFSSPSGMPCSSGTTLRGPVRNRCGMSRLNALVCRRARPNKRLPFGRGKSDSA